MSRVGKKIIQMDKIVDLQVNGNQVVVTGPKGSLSIKILDFVTLEKNGSEIQVCVKNETDKLQKAVWGTTRAILANMIVGVSTGFTKQLELVGVGYKIDITGDMLTLSLGFSHQVKINIPSEIKLSVGKGSKTPNSQGFLNGESMDKQFLNNFFGNIHEMKPCEPYKQKGFRFPNRFYTKKAGKAKGGKSK